MMHDDPPSSSLLRRAVDREPEAWRQLVKLYTPLVRYWCRQAGIPAQDVEDVSQDVFAAVSFSLATFLPDRPGTTFRAWLRGIARNKLRDHQRHRGQLAAGGSEAQMQLLKVPAPPAAPELDLELAETPDRHAAVCQRALERVKYECGQRTWTAFWRVAVVKDPPAEVAADLGITPAAIRKARSRVLHRIRQVLRELIT
jgi:RNA polymerase sigma-70 factor (ECF subfamily)